MAHEEPRHLVIQTEGNCQLREYEPMVVAETEVPGDFDQAGNAGFKRLAEFIRSEHIAMTAPVLLQSSSNGEWSVTFSLPSRLKLTAIHAPRDARVRIREIPARRMAVIRYSGGWSRRRFDQKLEALRVWIARYGMQATAEPIFARYNAPWTPWFLRRNEILLPVRAQGAGKSGQSPSRS